MIWFHCKFTRSNQFALNCRLTQILVNLVRGHQCARIVNQPHCIMLFKNVHLPNGKLLRIGEPCKIATFLNRLQSFLNQRVCKHGSTIIKNTKLFRIFKSEIEQFLVYYVSATDCLIVKMNQRWVQSFSPSILVW